MRNKNPELDPVISDVSLMLSLTTAEYEKALDRHPWSFLRQDQVFTTVAPYTTGTASFTNGSAVVIGTATAWAAAQVGMWLQVADQPPIKVIAVPSPTQLTLESAYPDATSTAPGAYKLFQWLYTLPASPGVKTVLHINNLRFRLRQFHQGFIRAYDPTMQYTSVPKMYTPEASNTVGLWPIPDKAYLHRVISLQSIITPTTLDAQLSWGLGDPFWLYDMVVGSVYWTAYGRNGKEHYHTLAQVHQQLAASHIDEQNERDVHNRYLPDDVQALPYANAPMDMTTPIIDQDTLQRLGL
jgi:hypothetical protein